MRLLLWIILIIETPLQLKWMHDWVGQYGFIGAIVGWFKSVQVGAFERTVVVDFCVFMAVVGFWILKDYKGKKLSPLFLSWCVLYLIFPSIAFTLYLLFLNPRHFSRKNP